MKVNHCKDCFAIYHKEHDCKVSKPVTIARWDTKDYPEIKKFTKEIKVTYFYDFCIASFALLSHYSNKKTSSSFNRRAAKGKTPEEAIANACEKFKDFKPEGEKVENE